MVKHHLSKLGSMLPKTLVVNRGDMSSAKKISQNHLKLDTVNFKNKTIHIAHMYPVQMNVYGDMGNIITLCYRLRARGYDVKYTAVQSVSELNSLQLDIVVGGGGQDSNQTIVHNDIFKYRKIMQNLHDDGTVGLMVCGMYQLLGNTLMLNDSSRRDGAQVFIIETTANSERIIGNVVAKSEYGNLVGFENHSGVTTIADDAVPLGRVPLSVGNNGKDGTEGVVSNNVFGTYMHGPVLAKNPVFADEIISRAVNRRYGTTELESMDDFVELQAANKASQRPR